MKDWIRYIKENLTSDLWGFIFIDYFKTMKVANEEASNFIESFVVEIFPFIKDPVHFHRVLLNACVQLLILSKEDIVSKKEIVFNKSIFFIKRDKDELTHEQIQEIIDHYDIYKRKEEFSELLIKNKLFNIIQKTQKSKPKNIAKRVIRTKKKDKSVIIAKRLRKEEEKPDNLKSERAILVTAIPEEFETVRSFFEHTNSYHHPTTKAAYEYGIFISKSISWEIMLLETGKFNEESAVETALLIEHFNPKIAIFIGTAGRLDKELNIGDILIPQVITGYNHGKDTKNEFLNSLESIKGPSYALLQYAKAIKRSKEFMQTLKNASDNFFNTDCNLYFDKLVVSGDITVKHLKSGTGKLIKQRYPTAKAVDMESIGFLKACSRFPIEYILIRSISDFLSNKAIVNESGSREFATKRAAMIAFEILRRIEYN